MPSSISVCIRSRFSRFDVHFRFVFLLYQVCKSDKNRLNTHFVRTGHIILGGKGEGGEERGARGGGWGRGGEPSGRFNGLEDVGKRPDRGLYIGGDGGGGGGGGG